MIDITNLQLLGSIRNAKQDEIIGALEGWLHMFYEDEDYDTKERFIRKFIKEWHDIA